jgi:hypothetical protein
MTLIFLSYKGFLFNHQVKKDGYFTALGLNAMLHDALLLSGIFYSWRPASKTITTYGIGWLFLLSQALNPIC